MIAQNDHDWDRSITLLREALAIYRADEAAAGQAESRFWLGRALTNWSPPERSEEHATEATRCFEESLRLFTRLGDWVGAAWCRIWLSTRAYWNDDLDRAEQLCNRVVQDCTAAGVRHPVGQALCNLAYIAHRRGHNDAALGLFHEAVAAYRDLDDHWQLAGLLMEQAAQQARMGRYTEALESLAESSRLDEQIGRLPERSFRLAVAAFVHLACGQPAESIVALGAYDAHVPRSTGLWRPGVGVGGDYAPWLADAVETTRAQLDAAEVAAAAAAARRKSLDEFIDELIIQPAKAAV